MRYFISFSFSREIYFLNYCLVPLYIQKTYQRTVDVQWDPISDLTFDCYEKRSRLYPNEIVHQNVLSKKTESKWMSS